MNRKRRRKIDNLTQVVTGIFGGLAIFGFFFLGYIFEYDSFNWIVIIPVIICAIPIGIAQYIRCLLDL